MKVLTVSTLFPNHLDSKHGIFIKTRLMHLLKHFPQVNAKVIAPVPWFPFKAKTGPFSGYAKYVDVKTVETIDGVEVHHPRYLVIPKIGMYLTPFFLFLSIWLCAKKIRKRGFEYEVIDGHYFYPDGVAVAMLSKLTKVPAMVTARGSDIHQIATYTIAKKAIAWAMNELNAVSAVCQALLDSMYSIANIKDKSYALRNGVDLSFFELTNSQQQIKNKSTWSVKTTDKLVISVGRLIELKGHELIIRCMINHPNCHLLIAGTGPEKSKLQRLIEELGLSERVRLLGALDQDELKKLYQAADIMVLASSREGWANVLLESMACGTPVVATNLWGTPEVVASEHAGVLVDRSVGGISSGLKELLLRNIKRENTRKYAEGFDWFETSQRQLSIFSKLINRNKEVLHLESNE